MALQIDSQGPEGATYGNGDLGAVVAHFGKMAHNYDAGCEKVEWKGPSLVYQPLHDLITKSGQNRAHAPLSVIDLGTGTGKVGELFKAAHTNIEITGIDPTREILDIALEKQRIDKGLVGSATDLSWFDGHRFDLATSSGVIDFIKDSDAFAEVITSIVKPGGYFAFTVEPAGTDRPGRDTYRHHMDTLRAQFENHGAQFLDVQNYPEAYSYKFKDPSKPPQIVENNVVVGAVL